MNHPHDPAFLAFGARVIQERLADVQAEVDGVRAAADIEYIHRMRVASRRLRSALEVASGVFPDEVWDACRKPLKNITRQLGEARDADVQIEFLEGYLPTVHAASQRAGIERLLLRLRERRTAVQPSVLEALDGLNSAQAFSRMGESLAQTLKSHAHAPQSSPHLMRLACRSIAERLEEIFAYVPFVGLPDKTDEHHQMRIAAKKLRYTLELFAPLFSKKDLKPYIEHAKEVQSVLGEMHDADVWIEWIPRFIAEEEQRLQDAHGHTQDLEKIAPGLNALRDERQSYRAKEYARFVALWRKQTADAVWTLLQVYLERALA
jgi:CHAD domain-containing protein